MKAKIVMNGNHKNENGAIVNEYVVIQWPDETKMCVWKDEAEARLRAMG